VLDGGASREGERLSTDERAGRDEVAAEGQTMKTVGVYERPSRGLPATLLFVIVLASVLVSALVISLVAS
jgi:hypothetical protein